MAALAAGWLAAGPAHAADQVLLERKGTPNATARYLTETNVTISAMGQEIAIASKEQARVRVVSVAENGDVTFTSELTSQEQTVMGQTAETPADQLATTTLLIDRRGRLKSVSSEPEPEPEVQQIGLRLLLAGNLVFSDQPVGVGDEWTHEVAADLPEGAKSAEASYTLVSFEEVDGVRCAKIEMTYRETEGSPPLTSRGTFWVEVASGDALRSEFEFNDLPFEVPGQTAMASGTMTMRRTGGSLFTPDTPSGEAPATEEDEGETIDKKVEGFEEIPGVVTLYRKTEDARDQIFMEIRRDQLDRLMMLQTTAVTGTSSQVVRGNPISDLLFKFVETRPGKITIVVPNYKFRADPGTPIGHTVAGSFSESFIETFDVEATQKDRESVLIDVSDLFVGDVSRVSDLFAGGGLPFPGLGGGGAGYSLDRQNTFVSAIKNFPENLSVESTYNFTGSGGGGGLAALLAGATSPAADDRSLVIRLNYNLFFLPVGHGFRPRRFDPRVGYFKVTYQDFTRDTAVNQTVAYVLRWNLQKQDPSAAVSPPVKPIVFWMDSGIPVEYRETVKAGILAWNQAFEAAGIRDAIEVRQRPDDADWDIGDMRYNTIRWVASPGSAYAVALFRVNPLTGEILNAGITVDANIVRLFAGEHDSVIDPASFFRNADPDRGAVGHVCADPANCRVVQLGMLPTAVGAMALDMLTGSRLPREEYVKQFVKWIVMHEMGHILGLRHNFVASTKLDMDQLGDKAMVDRYGTSASVMEYLPFNPQALGREGVRFFGDKVGTYDVWAIKYGYATPAEGTAEATMLRELARQSNTWGLSLQSDETADGFDPYVTRFDLGKYPIQYWTRMLELTRSLLMRLDGHSPRPGQSYWSFTRDFHTLLAMYSMSAAQAARYIGGLRLNANFRGDPGERPTIEPLPGKDQVAALELVSKYVFAPDAFAFPKRFFERFAPNPDVDMIQAFLAGPDEFPVRDTFAGIQAAALNEVMSPAVLSRVANNEFKAERGSEPLTLAYLFRRVGDDVWAELRSGAGISDLRRELQRAHLDALVRYAVKAPDGAPQDVSMLAWNELRRLREALLKAQGKAKDEYTPVHVEESLMRVTRALDAREMIGQPGGGGGGSLLEQLLGGARTPARARP